MTNWTSVKSRITSIINDVGEDVRIFSLTPTYSIDSGSSETLVERSTISQKVSLQDVKQDSLVNLDAGFREKNILEIYSLFAIQNNDIILRSNGEFFQIITPPDDHNVGGISMYYQALVAKPNSELELST